MLEQILEDKRHEVAGLDDRLLRNVRPSARDLRFSLGTGRQALAVFAEFKRRDPHEGDLGRELDVLAWAAALQELGIGALVVTTESRHWGGSRDDLVALDRQGVHIPLVRNDFIIEELQLYESRAAGADALFLRPGLVDDDRLQSFLRITQSMHMTGIPLVGTQAELDRVLPLDAPVLALANRDLASGRLDLQATVELAARIPASRSVVACFGIQSAAQIRQLRGHVDAVCLGSGLLRAQDPAAYLMQLTQA